MKIVVIGAGPAGLFVACLLKKWSFDVAVYERRDSLFGRDEHRSINLSLSTRGLAALSRLELDTKLIECATAMHGRILHNNKRRLFQPYSHNKYDCLYSVSRQKLIELLFNKAVYEYGIPIHLACSCTEIDIHKKIACFKSSKKLAEKVPYDFLLGCDGVHSVLRATLQQAAPETNCWLKQIDCGYQEILLDKATVQRFHLDTSGPKIRECSLHCRTKMRV